MLKKLSPTYILIGLYFFLSGVEYAVILPTLNLYLQRLNASSLYIGLVLSAYSLAGLVSAPIYGRITDMTGSTKAMVMLSNLFEIAGNLMYFIATNPNMILASRFVAGIGSGSASSIFGMISRATTQEERTAAFSQLMSLRQIGLIVGPACNLFLSELNFYMGSFHVDSFTSPGIFMALLWTLLEILMLFLYRDFSAVGTTPNSEAVEKDTADSTSGSSTEDISVATHSESKSPSVSVATFLRRVYDDLIREEVVVCLNVTFTFMFVQSGVETLLTPLTLLFFDWKELPNSIFFCVAGILLVISFSVIAVVSKKVSDRVMLLYGCTIMVGCYISNLFLVIFATKVPVGTTWVLVVFVVQSVVLILDFPFLWVPHASMFSKLTSAKTQGFNQGIRMLVMRIGQILGPLWASSLLDNLPLMGAINLAMVTLNLVMVVASYKRLEVPSSPTERNSANCEEEISEKTPLIQNNNVRGSINA